MEKNVADIRHPLVSIIVITYNSSKFVLETLESAKEQTYQNIELIITDDCSTDDTVAICEKWVAKNKARFVDTKLITVKENTGIPANCNRGLYAAKGVWIKTIAGDDILLDNCITDNISYVKKHKKTKFVFSKMNSFEGNINNLKETALHNLDFLKKKAKEQYKSLVIGGVLIPAPTGFLHKKTIIELGGFDEEIKLCEDYPMWLKATKEGVQLQFFNEVTVLYRVHKASIMNSLNMRYEQSMKKVFFKYRFHYLLKHHFLRALDLYVWNITRTHIFLRKISPYLSPLTYIQFFKNKFKNEN